MIEDIIKKERAVCGRRWYVVDGIMDTLCFPAVGLIKNACPPRLMIVQVECQWDKEKEKIQGLDHISIADVDLLIRQHLAIEGKIHIYIHIWHKLTKNKMENYKCDAQLGFKSANYRNIEELLGIWNRLRDFFLY